eukprot:2473886-Rhodomonas_salina.1
MLPDPLALSAGTPQVMESLYPAMKEYVEYYLKTIRDLKPDESEEFQAKVKEMQVRGSDCHLWLWVAVISARSRLPSPFALPSSRRVQCHLIPRSPPMIDCPPFPHECEIGSARLTLLGLAPSAANGIV